MKVTDVIRGSEDGLAGGLEHVHSDLRQLRKDVAHLMSEGTHRARDGASGAASVIGAGLRAFSDKGRGRASDAYECVSDFVTRRPVASIAIALGIGALAFGIFALSGRRDD